MNYKKEKPENIVLFNINDAKMPFFQKKDNAHFNDYSVTSPKSPYMNSTLNNDNWKDLEKGIHYEELNNSESNTYTQLNNSVDEYIHSTPCLYSSCPPPISGFHIIVNPDGTYQYQLNSCSTCPYNNHNATRIPNIEQYNEKNKEHQNDENNKYNHNEECIDTS